MSSDDTYAMFQCGGTAMAHRQMDNLHFTIYKRGFQALDTGNRIPLASITHYRDYQWQTVANNALLIRMPDDMTNKVFDYSHPGYRGRNVNYGGQNDKEGSKITAFAVHDALSCVAGDATGSYSPKRVSLVARQFIHSYPGLFVVFDRGVSKQPSFRKDWVLHFAQRPRLLDRQGFTSQIARGRLVGRTLLPEQVRTRVVEGSGRDEAHEFPLSEATWNRFDREAKLAQGKWRIDVSPTQARAATSTRIQATMTKRFLRANGPAYQCPPPCETSSRWALVVAP